MVMSEGRADPAPTSHNGHRVEAFDQVGQLRAEDLPAQGLGSAERGEVPEMVLDGRPEIFGAVDEPLRPEPFGRRSDPSRRQGDASGRRSAGSAEPETGGRYPGAPGDDPHVDDLLSMVRSYVESLTVQARADAEELLSHAHVQAELLRVRAEAVRAEAECLRAEAAALRSSVKEEAEAARARAESAAQTYSDAEDLRAAMHRETDDAREEFTRMRTEAMAIRRLLRAEVDAGLADTERMRGEVQRLWAETDKLAAVLRLLSAGAETAGSPVDTSMESGTWAQPDRSGAWAEELLSGAPAPQPQLDTAAPSNGRGIGVGGERRPPTTGASEEPQDSYAPGQSGDAGVVGERAPDAERGPQQSVSEPDRGGLPLDRNAAEFLRESWDAASGESTRGRRFTGNPVSSPGSVGAPPPEGGPVSGGLAPGVVAPQGNGKRVSQPLIGSGGWRQGQPRGPEAVQDDAPPEPPPSSRRRRRFHRE
jgi:hypothetical protein